MYLIHISYITKNRKLSKLTPVLMPNDIVINDTNFKFIENQLYLIFPYLEERFTAK